MEFVIYNGYLSKYNGTGENVVIPDYVTGIGNYAFENRRRLASVTIPNSVKIIGNEAFGNCSRLTSITIPDSVTSIGDGVFEFCSSLKNITIPSSVTSIGKNAFYNTAYYNDAKNWEKGMLYICRHLVDVKGSIAGEYRIKAGTLTIADSAFSGSAYLTSIIIPKSVTIIGDNAFRDCSRLKSVTIPNSVISIGDNAFLWHGLTSITIGAVISKIKAGEFDGEGNKATLTVNLLHGVTNLGEAFYGCKALKSINIPASVERINSRAFFGCEKLSELKIEEGVKFISDFAFADCTSLKEVVIPDSVEEIDEQAFADCKKLKNVSVPLSCAYNINSFPKRCKIKRRK